jgi:hypothetical protein
MQQGTARFYLEEHRPRSFKLRFDCIRPGTWRNANNKKQVRDCSDGTIIATGIISDDNSNK